MSATIGLIWVLAFGVATVLVRLGLSLVACGSVRRPAAAATLARAGVESAAATLAFWFVGAPLLLAAAGPFVGVDGSLLASQSTESSRLAASEVYHWAVALVGGAVVAGAVAERAKMRVGVAASAVLGGVVFPVLGRWVWDGWLRQRDMADVGGATAVLLPAAVFAAVAAAAVGPRAGRFSSPAEPLPAHSWPTVAVGMAVTVVGWMALLMGGLLVHTTPLNPIGVALVADAALNAALAASGGLLAGLGYARLRRPRRDDRPAAFCGTVGLIGGLAAITAAPVAMGGTGAVLVGVLAGVVAPAFAAVLDRRAKLDDPAGLTAAVSVGSVVGTLAAGLFAANGAVGFRRAALMATQSLGLATALVASVVAAVVTVAALRLGGPLQVDADDERVGLDAVELGVVGDGR